MLLSITTQMQTAAREIKTDGYSITVQLDLDANIGTLAVDIGSRSTRQGPKPIDNSILGLKRYKLAVR